MYSRLFVCCFLKKIADIYYLRVSDILNYILYSIEILDERSLLDKQSTLLENRYRSIPKYANSEKF
eukprot:UN24503